MKTLIAAIIFCLVADCLFAQTLFVPSGTVGTSTVTGKVGIGTSEPQIDLEVMGSGTGRFGQILRNTSASGYTTFRLFNDQNNQLRSLELDYSGTSYGGPLINGGPTGESGSITTTGAFPLTLGTSNIARMTIAANGNIGIGTNSPSQRLHVRGTTHGYINLEKSTNDFETGLVFTQTGGTTLFYIFNDNYDNNLKIQASGLAGEDDAKPRMQFPVNNRNIYMAQSGGNVGIGTSQPNHKLTVLGTIYSKEVKVDLSVPGPDYVFEEDYDLPSLSEVASYIRQNKHLPEMPSATEMEKDGIDLGAMNMLLLKKVEELTLYMIEQHKKSEQQLELIDAQNKRIADLEEQIKK